MKISILGTNGFLSTAIAKYYNQQGWDLVMYGLDEPKGHEYSKFYKVDLMNSELDYSILLNSDIIIYAIGAGIQANLHEGYDLIYNLNVTVPIAICNRLKELGYKGCLVTFGSVFEIGETRKMKKFTEKDILSSTSTASNDYAISKRMLSAFVASYKHDYRHWHFYIPTIYGEGENSKRLIPYTIYSIRNNESLNLTSGDQIRQYIYVNEIPRMLGLAYQKGIPSGVYNIEGKDTVTVKEIVTIVHHKLGVVVPDDCFGTAKRVDVGMKYLALDGEKLRNATGFIASVGIADVIDKY